MESYMEVTWINSVLLLVHSITFAFYISYKPQTFNKMLIYALAVPSLACLCFHPSGWIWMVLLESICFWWIFRYAWKSWLIFIALRLLWNFTCYVLYEGSFHLGLYFVPISTIPWALWLFLILSWFVVFRKWKIGLAQYDFVYPTTIFTTKVKLKMKGYLDSGNLLSNEFIPVIFVDHSYEEYFKNESIELVVMNTVEQTNVIRCFHASARVGNGSVHKVLVNSEKTLKLPMHCHALLNMYMMTQE